MAEESPSANFAAGSAPLTKEEEDCLMSAEPAADAKEGEAVAAEDLSQQTMSQLRIKPPGALLWSVFQLPIEKDPAEVIEMLLRTRGVLNLEVSEQKTLEIETRIGALSSEQGRVRLGAHGMHMMSQETNQQCTFESELFAPVFEKLKTKFRYLEQQGYSTINVLTHEVVPVHFRPREEHVVMKHAQNVRVVETESSVTVQMKKNRLNTNFSMEAFGDDVTDFRISFNEEHIKHQRFRRGVVGAHHQQPSVSSIPTSASVAITHTPVKSKSSKSSKSDIKGSSGAPETATESKTQIPGTWLLRRTLGIEDCVFGSWIISFRETCTEFPPGLDGTTRPKIRSFQVECELSYKPEEWDHIRQDIKPIVNQAIHVTRALCFMCTDFDLDV